MEYTKESLANTCILCMNKLHAKRIIKFYESFGFKKGYTLSNEEFDLIPGRTIGISTMMFQINRIDNYAAIQKPGMTFIKLPSTPRKKKLTFPREMMVKESSWKHWKKELVVGYLPNEKWGYLVRKKETIVYDEYIGYEEAKEI